MVVEVVADMEMLLVPLEETPYLVQVVAVAERDRVAVLLPVQAGHGVHTEQVEVEVSLEQPRVPQLLEPLELTVAMVLETVEVQAEAAQVLLWAAQEEMGVSLAVVAGLAVLLIQGATLHQAKVLEAK